MTVPILYSYRRCPYAMRARMALRYSNIQIDIHEINLKNKPPHMLAVSAKATVPLLVLADGTVIEQSLKIMEWALAKDDSDDWQLCNQAELLTLSKALITENDTNFKQALDHYKYAVRFPEKPQEVYRNEGEMFLLKLETLLNKHRNLVRDSLSITDIAIFPFIRQFKGVDENWFLNAPYPKLKQWLNELVNTPLFIRIMQK
jgi:glutathione S-transferase